MGPRQRVAIGQVVAPHGLSGEVKVYPLTDFPERFRETEKVALGEELLNAHIQHVRQQKNLWLVKFREINDRTAAEKIRGAYLYVDESETVELPEGSFYTFELVGCEAVSEDGEPLGQVKDVMTGSGNDLLVLGRQGRRDAYVPFAREFVKDIDLKSKRIVIRPIPGLLE